MLEDIVRRSMPVTKGSVVGRWKSQTTARSVQRMSAEKDYIVEKTRSEMMKKLQDTAQKAETQMAGLRKALEESEMRAHVAKVTAASTASKLEEQHSKLKSENTALKQNVEEQREEVQMIQVVLRD